MKKINLKTLIILPLFLVNNLHGQMIEEPDFVGESIYLKDDNTTIKLEKQLSQIRTVSSTGLVITGIGKIRNQLQVEGCCSSIKLPNNQEIKIIVRAVDNQTDPLSIIKVFKFEKKKNFRRAEYSSTSSFGSSKSNNFSYVNFSAKKYGNNSYLITLPMLSKGEYGITIVNPNNLTEKQTVVSTFAVM